MATRASSRRKSSGPPTDDGDDDRGMAAADGALARRITFQQTPEVPTSSLISVPRFRDSALAIFVMFTCVSFFPDVQFRSAPPRYNHTRARWGESSGNSGAP